MKKILFAAIVCVCVAVAGTAMAEAYGGRGHGGRHYRTGGYGGMGMGYDSNFYGGHGYHEGCRFGGSGGVDVPKDILDKRVEAEKVAIDLRAELSKRPVNRAKALELYKKHQTLRLSISDWCFQQRLNAAQ